MLLALLAQEFKYDAWESWNTFGVGASVEHLTETESGPTTIVRTIDRKDKDLIALRVVRRVKVGDKEVETPETEHVKKPGADDPTGPPACYKCKKVHPRDVKESRAKVKVADVDLDCTLLTSIVVDCEGKKTGTIKRWYHKDVPGWIVRMETIVEEMKTAMTCARYDKR